jgi:Tfp pilus assembly PilM family ATPase
LARFLGLDWDNHQLHLVAATTGRGTVRVERAVVWQDDFSPAPARAEAVGQKLRDYLRSAGIAAAPVLATVGRDRVILKELRHPSVPASEEPALVRFQASKELTDGAESMVIDYAAKGLPAPSGEKTAFAFAIRRDALLFLQAVCKTAGLKLLAVTPRGYGIAACLKRAAGTAATPAPESAEAALAVLTVAGAWAEFSVVRGETLLFARALPADGNLAAEVRRNLAVYGGQASAARDRVQALYVAAGAAHAPLTEQLRGALSLPVHALDPFARDEGLPPVDDAGGFAAAVGLLAAWATHRKAPINFAQPKEPVKHANPETQRALRVAAIAGAGVLVALVLCWLMLSNRKGRLEDLSDERARLDEQLVFLGPDAKHIQAIKEWNAAGVTWLDALYDVTARFDWRQGFHLTEFNAGVIPPPPQRGPTAPKTKMKYVGQYTLFGQVRAADESSVRGLKAALSDPNHRPELEQLKNTTKIGIKTFQIKTEVTHLEPKQYTTKLTPPTTPSRVNRPLESPKTAPAVNPLAEFGDDD